MRGGGNKRGASLTEYGLLLFAVILAAAAAVRTIGPRVKHAGTEAAKCLSDGGGGCDGSGGPAGGGDFGVTGPGTSGTTASGGATSGEGAGTGAVAAASTAEPAASGEQAGPKNPYRREATAAQSPDGSKKFFTGAVEAQKTKVDVTAALADMSSTSGKSNVKIFGGSASAEIGGVKAGGSMVEAGYKDSVLGVPVDGKGKLFGGDAEAGVKSGGDTGIKLGAKAYVFRGEVGAGQISPSSSGDVRLSVVGTLIGAGAKGGFSVGDSDGDGLTEVEVTVEAAAVIGGGVKLRVEAPRWLGNLWRK